MKQNQARAQGTNVRNAKPGRHPADSEHGKDGTSKEGQRRVVRAAMWSGYSHEQQVYLSNAIGTAIADGDGPDVVVVVVAHRLR